MISMQAAKTSAQNSGTGCSRTYKYYSTPGARGLRLHRSKQKNEFDIGEKSKISWLFAILRSQPPEPATVLQMVVSDGISLKITANVIPGI